MLVLPRSRDPDDGKALLQRVVAAADRTSNVAGPDGGSFMTVFENLKTHFHLTWWSEEVAAGGMGAGAAASEETPSSLRLLKAARGADIVLALISTSQGIDQAMDDSGTSAVALLRAQEMSAVVRALDGLAELPTKQAGDFRNGPSSS